MWRVTNRARRHIPRPSSFRPAALRPTQRQVAGPWIPDVERSTAIVDCAVYVDGVRQEPGHDERGRPDWRAAHDQVVSTGTGFVWIGLHEPSNAQLAGLAEHFNLHPLAVEDAVSAHQRPKLESYDDEMLFAVVKTVHYDETAVSETDPSTAVEVVDTGEVMVFLGSDYVITVRHGEHGGLHALRKRLEQQQALLAEGPSSVLHGILDHVVDDYLAVAEALQRDIDEMEVAVFGGAARSVDTNRMYILKREVLALQRSAAPLTAPLRSLGGTEMPLVAEEFREYFRDVNDHLGQVIDQVTAFDDLLNTLVSAHLAQVSVVQNEDMRKISAWVAIAAVPTMVAGIYGMNFTHMPELRWRFGYPMVVGIVVCVCLWLHRSFKRAGWL
ncbi:magnesium transporter [Frankineae bacterium MT45]|nr:magnesium transporter [Frankineae bacterium MT45]